MLRYLKPKTVWHIPKEEIPTHLATKNMDVVEELFALVLSLHSGESDRTKAIDAKAAATFGLVGILTSAAVLAVSSKPDQPFGYALTTPVGRLYTTIVMGLLLLAIILLFCAVKVGATNSAPNDKELFGSISECDGREDQTYTPLFADTKPDGHKYRRLLCDHYWKLYRAAFEKNEHKAHWLAWGQNTVFLALVVIIVFQMYVVINVPAMPEKTAPQPSPAPKVEAPAQPTPPQSVAPLRPSAVGRPTNDSVVKPMYASAEGRSTRLSAPKTKPTNKDK